MSSVTNSDINPVFSQLPDIEHIEDKEIKNSQSALQTSQIISSDPIESAKTPNISIIKKKFQGKEAKYNQDILNAVNLAQDVLKTTLLDAGDGATAVLHGVNAAFLIGFVIGLPKLVYKTSSIAEKFKQMNPFDKALTLTDISYVIISTANSAMAMIQKAQIVSGPAHAGLAKATSFLGPIGMGLGAVVAATKGTISARAAARLSKKSKALKQLTKGLAGESFPIINQIFKREHFLLKVKRKIEIVNATQSYLVAIALGAGAVVGTIALTGVAVAALATNPVGWAMLGIFGAASLIALGAFIYRSYQSKRLTENSIKEGGMGQVLVEQMKLLNTNQMSDLILLKNNFNISKGEHLEQFAKLISEKLKNEPDKTAALKEMGLKIEENKKTTLDLNNENDLLDIIQTKLTEKKDNPGYLKDLLTELVNEKIEKSLAEQAKNSLKIEMKGFVSSTKFRGVDLGKMKALKQLTEENKRRTEEQLIENYCNEALTRSLWSGSTTLVQEMRLYLEKRTKDNKDNYDSTENTV